MSGLLWLLLIAGLFYFMMRFGCGSHVIHGHGGADSNQGSGGEGAGGMGGCGMSGGDHAGHSQSLDYPVDPVCKMPVEPGIGYVEHWQSREYHLCSKTCLEKFDAEREKYT